MLLETCYALASALLRVCTDVMQGEKQGSRPGTSARRTCFAYRRVEGEHAMRKVAMRQIGRRKIGAPAYSAFALPASSCAADVMLDLTALVFSKSASDLNECHPVKSTTNLRFGIGRRCVLLEMHVSNAVFAVNTPRSISQAVFHKMPAQMV